MQVKQGDLFWGMDSNFVKDVMDTAEKVTFNEGDIIFEKGEPADYMYVLIKGRVKLTIGDEDNLVVYVAQDPGQVIGWSTILERDAYSASAECPETTVMMRLEKNSFLQKLDEVPESGAILYKRIARMLGDRLLALYPSMT